MNKSLHALKRMNQRGVTREMIELVLEHGRINHDKRTLGRKDAQRLLCKMQREMQVLKKIVDKGGVVVVTDSDTIITTYNYRS